jgi:uncharacterized protein YjdB
MDRPRFSMFAALFTLFLAGAVGAQDAVTVGTVTASGTTVDVPISIRDVAGTPLGIDRPAGSKIQSFSIKVTYAPVSAVASIAIERDGITASLSPTSEFKPTTASSVSILDTFQESTNPIPFTLNGTPPGNRVAHLLVTLSSSATPGTTITLALDSSLTQLTDAGGSAATKETEGNGQLTLVDGSITIPNPTLTLTPTSLTVPRGGAANLTARLSISLTSPTTVSLLSSNPGVAGVPTSVVIPAGVKSETFEVTGVSDGTASITATLPPAIGSSSDSSDVTVTEIVNCATPSAPLIAPAVTSANSGAQYSIAWLPVTGATGYLVDESVAASFADATTITVNEPPATFAHSVAIDTRYYYRVRARNHSTGCDITSAASATVSVLIAAPAEPVQSLRVLPVVGSTAGNFGSFFKTSVQLFNSTDGAISGQIVYHPNDGSADATLAYALTPGKSIAWEDLLPAMNRAGLGSADIVADLGSAVPVSSVRVFNDAGVNGTTGLNEEAFRAEDALQAGETGALIAPADFARFRLNIGVRTLEQGAVLSITVRDRDGNVLKTLDRDFAATHFEQPSSSQFLLGHVLTGGESIAIRVTSGSAFLYGATTDNKTNDPSIQFAQSVD